LVAQIAFGVRFRQLAFVKGQCAPQSEGFCYTGPVVFRGREMASHKESVRKPKCRSAPIRKAGKQAPLSAGAWFEKLVALQARLRAPNGCPWDREQTHTTLRTYLIEEAYEVLDALESGDDEKFAEEMGDLLLQVIFHSQIATEEGRFTISDVIREVHEKMVRRHPHVFGNQRAKDAAEVLKTWHQIKVQERRAKNLDGLTTANEKALESALDGVPRTLPATLEGLQLTKKAARTGFDWDNTTGIFDKMREETAELQGAIDANKHTKVEEELGDLLFAAVNLARFLQVDPEIALKNANAKFVRRFHQMERLAQSTGRKFEDVPRAEKESLWDSAKRGQHRLAAQKAARSQ
jgi:tetrapyrrole methylase family protein/MazG family protein